MRKLQLGRELRLTCVRRPDHSLKYLFDYQSVGPSYASVPNLGRKPGRVRRTGRKLALTRQVLSRLRINRDLTIEWKGLG